MIGPRLAGNTTLAYAVATGRPSLYLGLNARACFRRLPMPVSLRGLKKLSGVLTKNSVGFYLMVFMAFKRYYHGLLVVH